LRPRFLCLLGIVGPSHGGSMKTYWETIHETTNEGFDIALSVAPETENPRDHFAYENEEDNDRAVQDIESGALAWFMVRVQAFKKGVLLGEDYLGGCCYQSVRDFITPGEDYYQDMVNNATDEAKRTLKDLKEEA
jgi:hypothetical protein